MGTEVVVLFDGWLVLNWGGLFFGECLLVLFSRCSGFGGAYVCIGVLWVARGVGVGEAWKLASACMPPGHFFMVDLVCGVGTNCIVHAWWWHECVVDGGSHSWHVHSSTKMSWSVGMG